MGGGRVLDREYLESMALEDFKDVLRDYCKINKLRLVDLYKEVLGIGYIDFYKLTMCQLIKLSMFVGKYPVIEFHNVG